MWLAHFGSNDDSLNWLILPFTLPPEQITIFLSWTLLLSISQSFIQIISQLHSYELSDIHNSLVPFHAAIVRGKVFNRFFLISRHFTLLIITPIIYSPTNVTWKLVTCNSNVTLNVLELRLNMLQIIWCLNYASKIISWQK